MQVTRDKKIKSKIIPVQNFITGLGDQFGGDVALNGNGNSLAVGAIGEASNDTDVNGDQSNNDAIAAGAVYVY